jgi:TRAP-type C4-dicarboxylate transport system permease large subunit
MARILLEGLGLFLLPFMLFTLWLAIKGHNPLQPEVWSRKALSSLTLAAIALCILGLIVLGMTRGAGQGSYTPTHVGKDGQIVPGQFR